MLKLDRYTTHPNFWKVGTATSVGKHYVEMHGLTEYDNVWVKSDPYGATDFRVITYEYFIGAGSPVVTEWEKWWGDKVVKQAILSQYGGATEALTRASYQTTYHWSKGISSRGQAWPELDDGETIKSVPHSLAMSGTEAGTYTGSIRLYLEETFDAPNSANRISKVNTYLPTTISPVANAIGKIAQEVALIWQFYVTGVPLTDSEQYSVGCEATVYAWGYPESSENNYRNWIRNGELRWSTYLWVGSYTPATLPALTDSWWRTTGARALTEKENWIYDGKYRLNSTTYNDNGTA